VAKLGNVTDPITDKLPNIPVDPVILTVLPDILLNKYMKLPSPSK
jgi:hypothetical protein